MSTDSSKSRQTDRNQDGKAPNDVASQPAPGSPPPTVHSRGRRELAARVLRAEADAIGALEARLGPEFDRAVELILACEGAVIVTGMGKAGLVGAKISATLASTGTPSHTLHPSEALHGDLGRIRKRDVLLVLSNSGETAEIKSLVPAARRIGASVIALTGRTDSILGKRADCTLDIGQLDEADPMGLAPTASTSAMLALGDALAMVVHSERGFGPEDFARYHPAGALGRKMMRVEEIMRRGERLPLAPAGSTLREVLDVMTKTPGRPGAALIVAADGKLAGIFTDGDLRRLCSESLPNTSQAVDAFMGHNPKSIGPDQLVDEAERFLREFSIDQIPVVDAAGHPVGLLDIQDVLDVRV